MIDLQKHRLDDLFQEVEMLVGVTPDQPYTGWFSQLCTIVSERQGRYWNRDCFRETYSCLKGLTDNQDAFFDAESLRYFLTSFQAYRQVISIIRMLDYKYIETTTKTRLYVLPIYITLVEGCISNIMRLIVSMLNNVADSDYSNIDHLRQLSDVLNKNGFAQLANSADINLRNAINHGGVYIENDGNEIIYNYKIGKERIEKTISSGELCRMLYRALDIAGSSIIAIIFLMGETPNSSDLLTCDDVFLRNSLAGIALSDLGCQSVYTSEVERIKQVNLTFEVDCTEQDYIFKEAERILIGAYSALSSYDSFFVSFNSSRLIKNFFKATRADIDGHIDAGSVSGDLLERIAKNRNYLWMARNDAVEEPERLEFYSFPQFESKEYSIYEVEDVSLDDRKRLSANVYVGNTANRDQILDIISRSIDWMKHLENCPSPKTPTKHGAVEADCVYLNVYHHDYRKQRELYPKNTNFICKVEYCSQRGFELAEKNGFISWIYKNKEARGNTRIYWRVISDEV